MAAAGINQGALGLATAPVGDLSVTPRQLSDFARTGGWVPTGAIAENIPHRLFGSSFSLASGTLTLCGGIVLPGGRAISSISFMSNAAPVTPANQWFCLVDRATLTVLATTVDDTTTAWSAATVKTLLLATAVGGAVSGGTYTPTTATEVYVGVNVTAGTATTLRAFAGLQVPFAVAPILAATSTTSLTTPASLGGTAGALTGIGSLPYCYVS